MVNANNMNTQIKQMENDLFEKADLDQIDIDCAWGVMRQMDEWCRVNIPTFETYLVESGFGDEDCTVDEWLSDDERWWLDEFKKQDDNTKSKIIEYFASLIQDLL